ncbi:MAG: hypothetical protein ACI9HY_003719, partial [Planctomycetaceae bacterium]
QINPVQPANTGGNCNDQQKYDEFFHEAQSLVDVVLKAIART